MTWPSDNTKVDLIGFSLADCLALAAKYNKQVVYYAVEQAYKADPAKSWETSHGERLVLGWTKPLNTEKEGRVIYNLPFPVLTEDMEPIIKAWLKEVERSPEPDHDGDNGKGFRFYNEAWGHVGGDHTTFIAIEPCWLLYGK